MKKYSFKNLVIITAVMAGLLMGVSGCTASASNQEGFAIYLTKNNIPPAQMPAQSHVEIADQPFIGINDIVTYNEQTCEMKLTAEAFKRITELQVPVEGKSFMVCVDKAPIYFGAFWTPISSISFDGVTIWKPYSNIVKEPYIVTLELGYPDESFYGGKDPRNNADIIKSLEKAGKLVRKLTIDDITVLPDSMKGYELYSWREVAQWHFTLITGTNRNKTVEEITTGDNFVSETGWERIHVTGLEAIKTVIGKLPQKASVFWLGQPRAEPTPGVNFDLPDAAAMDAIRERAKAQGVELSVVSP